MVFLSFFCRIKSFLFQSIEEPPLDSIVIEIPSNLAKEDDGEIDERIVPEIKNLFT